MNIVELVGRVANKNGLNLESIQVKDPQTGAVKKTTSKVTVSVAVRDEYKKNPDGTDRANFIYVTFFGKSAENIVQFFTVGSNIAISAHIETSSKVDQATAQTRYFTNLIGDKYTIIDSKEKTDEIRQNHQAKLAAQGNAQYAQPQYNAPQGQSNVQYNQPVQNQNVAPQGTPQMAGAQAQNPYASSNVAPQAQGNGQVNVNPDDLPF